MNILLINHYAGSLRHGMEYRPYYFAQYWKDRGHNVTIIASSNSHVRSYQPNVNKNIQNEIIDEINYIWIKTPSYNNNSFKRILNILIFIIKIYLKAEYLAKLIKPNVVISSSTYPLDIFPAKRITKKSNAKLIFEVHDLWPLSPIELGGFSKYNPFIITMQLAENYAYRNCDSLVSMLPKTLEYMVIHGLRPDKFNYIPNGINIDEWENMKPIPYDVETLVLDLKSKGNTIIAYTGAHGIANALDSFIEAANLIKNYKVSFLLVGSGPEKKNLEKKVLSLHLSNVIFINSIPKDSIPKFLGMMDILYIGLKKQPLFRFGISPNKLIDYLMAGKPIIQAIDAGNDIVSEAKCGISVEPENPYKIAEAITNLLNLTDKAKLDLGNNGNAYVLNNHDYKILSENFLNILENITTKT